ncbi:MAG: serine hydrolase domain-containing protein [Tagaea sp.]
MDDFALANAAETVASRLTAPEAPGAAIGIVRGTRTLFRGAFGLASIELGAKLAPETVMTVASVTKQFTCLAMWMLAREGKIDPDGDALPGISFQHLMRNVSGLPDLMETFALGGGDLSLPVPRVSLLDLVKRQTARNFAPGADFNYCNTNFALLQEAAERIEGRPFADTLAARILAPARMTSARLGTRPDEIVPGLASGYLLRDGRYVRAIDAWPGGGEGGLRASLDDMIAWAKNWSTREVGGDLLDVLARPLPFANGAANFYACGLQVLPWRGLATVGHGGLMPGFLTEFCRVPAEDLTVIVIANSDRFQPWLVAREILDRAHGLDPDEAYATEVPQGDYLSADGRTTLELLVEDGRAKARQHGVTFPLARDLSALRGAFAFRWDGSGVVRANGERMAYMKIARGPLPAGLDGVWRNAELGAAYAIDGTDIRIDGPLRVGVTGALEPFGPATFRIKIEGGPFPRAFDAHLRSDGTLIVDAARSRGFIFSRTGPRGARNPG